MKRRTIIGIIFIVAALLKLADMWGIVQLDWLWQHQWTMYLGVFLILFIGVELVISSYRHNPEQWLQRPLPTGEEGKRICCSVHYGGDEYIYHGRSFIGGVSNHAGMSVKNDAPSLHVIASNFFGGVSIRDKD